MGPAIEEVLPAAIGVVLINPLPIMAVILMLLSPQSKGTATSFVVGWAAGMIVAFALLLFVLPPDPIVGDASDPSTLSSIVRLLLGCALLVLAFRQWRGRPRAGEAKDLPSWMASLDTMTPMKAVGFGAMLSGLNPKNLAFTIAAVVAIAQAELTTGQKVIPVAIYILLASVGVAAPVIWFLVDPERAAAALTGWRDWLVANYATVMAIVLLLFGVTLFARGLGSLIG